MKRPIANICLTLVVLVLLDGCGAAGAKPTGAASSAVPASSTVPASNAGSSPHRDGMPHLFEECIFLPEAEALEPTQEQKGWLAGFLEDHAGEVCEIINGNYEATTAVYLLDVTGDSEAEICVSGLFGSDVSDGLTDHGSATTVVFDLESGQRLGVFEGGADDFYWCRTESGEVAAFSFELNWTRSYRSGPDVWYRTHILWEHQWKDGQICSTPRWLYLYQSQSRDDGPDAVEDCSVLSPDLAAVQAFRQDTDKQGRLADMLEGGTPGLAEEIPAFLEKLEPLPKELYYWDTAFCKEGQVISWTEKKEADERLWAKLG